MGDGEMKSIQTPGISRRKFLKTAGAVALSVGLGEGLTQFLDLGDGLAALPVSGGYLLYDSKKCAGCESCMLACSMVHEGECNLSMARIQIGQNSLAHFPTDITMNTCRQCLDPKCVDACPTGACHVDSANGNVRLIDPDKCIGCQACIRACPFAPSRSIWNFKDDHAQKCDLCVGATYSKQVGGPKGKQACVEVCPMHALKFTTELPAQTPGGYEVNLRGPIWERLKLSK